ncbi:DNA-directed RNA polymerase subunit beta [Candidatus Falkowbacteria bacterium RIFOXYD2_FULL_35_9]|uniref:DNA-directed RNA polymerase subunit beta n=1 Tax=Candidatus Falkowbacteria bacterium RIFOXYC2_FULL_36_12 TaxID=1798002 RepID=A0A1F5T312_9BACT|nr:MAG: DNA-directed RNA polymerase subunit beta [Candidatus Falkowbacteria bacterium RIFOXYB2_FULL_35_7]OGF33340.1 MAG: DNA-directed RNA polymerase subunit beta [Candidatus Falkowbacteria bacterium RIFOXYC2_FULL_36_12]OGF34223.1 MAG: DNA-directed RNA polymerase subunit beta [Candidatus Falkowbacteria bacterium RIFOXYA2_FULL_35_8]OGF47906.1 MAG: DNA-directed RNA polymerase subunit beta [Candidatus Falkowbacteria bacterium RIFOXYD2_FULL_35_9]
MSKKAPDRKYFTKIYPIDPPDLIEIQKNSYYWFLKEGLGELFEEISPIIDVSEKGLELHFDDYYLDEPKFDEVTSKSKNITYEAPIRIKATLKNTKTKQKETQEIFLGDFPLITDRGTFIINGIERAIVSQIIRSAGVFFTSSYVREKNRRFYGAKIIPNRGAWLEIETDANNVIWVKIDRKRKVAITSLLRAFGVATNEEILNYFKDVDNHEDIRFIESTLAKDISTTVEDGLIEVYKRIRPGDLATPDNARSLIYSMFFNFSRYDFGKVGRYKMNQRFGTDYKLDDKDRVLKIEDVVNVIKEIIKLNITQEDADDIDHLGNRRIRAVGELIQNRFRVGLARMERIVKDRMSTMDPTTLTPSKLINARPVIGVVKEFFMSSQLSQFMDQTNPLSELEHKRRISAMGPGGLSRERAGFDVRDVHATHYGRICPIATPEGPNIGLVGHLASYARVNEFGFIETPYFQVEHLVTKDLIDPKTNQVVFKKGDKVKGVDLDKCNVPADEIDASVENKVTTNVVYLNAIIEEKSIATSSTAPVDDNGYFLDEKLPLRKYSKPDFDYVYKIDHVDVSSNQIVSVATALIPFLEHDDAVRALMGTNMQRQAVPTVRPQSPIVGTGMEAVAARDSGHVLLAEQDGEVVGVQGDAIRIKYKDGKTKTHSLNKYICSNSSTSLNQMPIVDLGDKIKKGQVIADGPSVDKGELALGQNVLVGYMAYEGFNYEDAIVISEKVVQRDTFSSIHIDNYSIDVRETKLGSEMVTSDIPNISEEKLNNLDAEGIVRVGAFVQSGDILVGKITPKGETELSAEEKLLKAIFGEKARDVRDTSLRLEHGEQGKVVDIKIFSQENGDKLSPGVIKTIQISVANLRKVQVGDKLAGRHGNKGVISRVVPVEDMPFMEDGTPLEVLLTPLGIASRMNLGQILETHLGLAAHKLGYKVATPVFNGISEETIQEELKKAGYPESGQITLTNGKTGEQFDHQVTVGYNYILKLNHMVDDKIHQRSIGPYSLITQQPLGGKAQFGGQRFGEMEVWALEAYGAAHTLQEILTIKSDDVLGRAKAYESIIKGEPIRRLNVPESFNVLIRELKGLCLDVELMKGGKTIDYQDNDGENEGNRDQR